MLKLECPRTEAEARLANSAGFVRAALEGTP